MSGRSALITGISGQDGSYLGEQLLAKDYTVCGLVREGGLGLAESLAARVTTRRADLRDGEAIAAAVGELQPDELYHLAAVTRPGDSWGDPQGTFDVVGAGTVRLLEAVRTLSPHTRVFVAGSAEVFGTPDAAPQDERTPFLPRNPYGASKAAAVAAARAYRSGAGLFVAVGLLFNHESPRRPLDFVTRKVTWHAAAIASGRATELRIGDLAARRDWGYAPDYVEGAWRAVQAQEPGDFVFATGTLHSVGDLVDIAFARAGVPVEGHVISDPAFVRSEGAVPLVGDPSRAQESLDWAPRTSFESMIDEMVDADLQVLAA